MAGSIIYSRPVLYEAAMFFLYGRHYPARYRIVADLIPPNSSVLDLCCGPAILFHRYLRHKAVQYTGFDRSERFIGCLCRQGGRGQVWDVGAPDPLPPADYVVMQASLYQFLPEPGPVVDRMLQAARRQVIIAEPIRNMADSKIPLAAFLARRLTDAGKGPAGARFTRQSLELFLKPYMRRCARTFLIPGGREQVYVLNGPLQPHYPGEETAISQSPPAL